MGSQELVGGMEVMGGREVVGGRGRAPAAVAAPVAAPTEIATKQTDADKNRARRVAASKAAGFRFVDFPIVKDDGSPVRAHIENTRALLDAYGIKIRYNEMTHMFEHLGIPSPPSYERSQEWGVAFVESRAEHHGLNVSRLGQHIALLADSYHPVRDWIEAQPWDRQDRFVDLFETLNLSGETPPELAISYLTIWLITLGAMLQPWARQRRVAAQGVLVLLGKQGRCKTRWIQSLMPNPAWIAPGLLLDPTDRDSKQQVTTAAITELGELDGSFARKQGIMPAIKAFVTNPTDRYRTAYARREEDYQRRTIFAATVNNPQFLDDDTGNRRWWIIEIEGADANHNVDMQQVWAQAYAMAAEGSPWWPDQFMTDACLTNNENYQPVDVLEQEVLDKFEADPCGGMTYQKIFAELNFFNGRKPTALDSRRVGAVLKSMGAKPFKSGPCKGMRVRIRIKGAEEAR